MPHPSPDCIWAESEYDTCLALGYSMDKICEACKKVGQERLLKAIFPNGPPENVAFIQVDEEPEEEPEKEDESLVSFDIKDVHYPFDLLFLNKETKEIYNEIHVTGPGVMDVAPGKQYKVDESEVHIRFADGTTIRSA